MTAVKTGKVSLIGSGPGDLELLTLKAVRLLKECDVVFLDDLANPDILQFAKPDVEVLLVGKRPGKMHTAQEWIIEQMIAYARAGKNIARVKGGDPFIFGRGGEEIEALAEAGITFEIVSGLTAGIAVPARLGIPLTHRHHASGVTFITGHSCKDEDVNWRSLVDSRNTIVIYMGIAKIDEIVSKLIANGQAIDTAVVIIENGTLPEQRYHLTNLGDLATTVKDNHYASPSIIVIGTVVTLHSTVESSLNNSASETKQHQALEIVQT
ncbi:MAG: uroporphyrinogen-III C-methyltransferase [Candidatus Obscuribacterales bacterium]|nr:uroporphyrinogen-III C-methyltransferase [Candidatus Obscuribacterales bacterium]